MSRSARSVADAWLDAFCKKSLDSLELAADFSHHSPFGVVEGRKAYLKLVAENTEAFFSKTIRVVDVLDSGERFAYRYTVDGRAACDCIYVRNGQIAEIHSYYHFGEPPSL